MAVSSEPVPLRRAWYEGRYASWLVTTDHKRIGMLYISTSLLFFVGGGVLALLMRSQLATANEDFIVRDSYSELFTIHGTAMVFLVVVPILAGFGNFLVPLMIGARDVAFPRLNAMSYWFFLFGGLTLFLSFFAGGGAAKCGWTCYAPLSESQYTPGHGVDLWILSLHLLTIASLAGAINFVTTIHNMRTGGMTWMRLPLFVWTIEIYSVMLIFVLPALSAGLTLLLLDRNAGTHFFDPTHGGSAVLWQHVFWFFGHPEVYIMILPAMGIVSEVIPVFARKPIFGYKAVALSTVGIGFFSMLVWAHHMFAIGMPIWLQSFFMITSLAVAVPTGVKIFNWLATTWRGNLSFDTPMLFALGFIAVFTIGGLTGIFLAAFPVDWALTDTYFVVAHMHYVLFGGSILGNLRRPPLLVAEDVRPAAERDARQVDVLAHVHRPEPRVLPDAPPRPGRDAAPRVHVLRGGKPAGVQLHLHRGILRDGLGRAPLPLQRPADAHVARGAARGQRSVAREHARVVHDLAAASAQLRLGAVRHERAAAARPAAEAEGAR